MAWSLSLDFVSPSLVLEPCLFSGEIRNLPPGKDRSESCYSGSDGEKTSPGSTVCVRAPSAVAGTSFRQGASHPQAGLGAELGAQAILWSSGENELEGALWGWDRSVDIAHEVSVYEDLMASERWPVGQHLAYSETDDPQENGLGSR